MSIKSAANMLAAANAEIETIDVAQAKALLGRDGVVFVDVRESVELAGGRITGAAHAPRGMLEFQADPAMPMHNPALAQDKRLVLYCGTGGRSALSAKTLKDMGFTDVCHIAGGFTAWRQADGAVET